MKPLKAFLALTLFFVTFSTKAMDQTICEIRSALTGSIAQERDKGTSRERVKKQIPKKLGAMSSWVDAVYDHTKGMTPNQVAEVVKISCLRE